MANEGGEWIMKGLGWEDPYRIRSWRELISWINEVGFLPLFAGEVPGFSAEEHVSPLFWWTGDPGQDPWEWREIISGTGEVAYGKFFHNRAGFISREWFPYFANARRDGYDFDAAWDDELIQRRYKAIMDICEDGGMHPGFELKTAAGFSTATCGGRRKGWRFRFLRLYRRCSSACSRSLHSCRSTDCRTNCYMNSSLLFLKIFTTQ